MTAPANLPLVGPGFYTHYKRPDRYYFVLGTGVYRTDGESLDVCYLSLYDSEDDDPTDGLHTRALWEWHEPVNKPDYSGARFVRVQSEPWLLNEVVRRMAARLDQAENGA